MLCVIYMYNVNLRKAQDYDLWGRLLLHDIILCNIPCCLLKYRITQKSQTTETLSKQARVAEEVRKGLLAYLGIDFSEKELVLHNEICNGRICDVAAAEQWLLKLREFFVGSLFQPDFIYKSTDCHSLGITLFKCKYII